MKKISNLSNLSVALVGAGFVFALLALIVLCVRAARNKKVFNAGVVFLLSLTIAALGTGGVSIALRNKIPDDVLSLKAIEKVLPAPSNAPRPDSGSEAATSGEQPSSRAFTQASFDPNGSVRPKVIKNDTVGGIQAIIDADGTETLVCSQFAFPLFINPDHSAYGFDDILGGSEADPGNGQMYLFVPNGKEIASKGHGCTEYSFNKDGDVNLEQYNNCYYTDKGYYSTGYSNPTKSQSINEDAMTYADFINDMIPVKNPSKTVENHILNGNYKCASQDIVGSSSPVTMDFNGKDLTLKCDAMDINSTYGYAMEPIGKNAYKLYLYFRSVVKDEDTVRNDKFMYGGEPQQNTFFIYMDAQNKFDFVYFTFKNRYSLTMTR